MKKTSVFGSRRPASGSWLTQPAVSRQVSLLERQAGTQLVLRSRRGVLPTEAGRLLLGHADAVLRRLALAEDELGALTGLRSGRVRLGSFFTALAHLSPEVWAAVEADHPGVRLEDVLVDRRAAFRGLLGAELEVAVVFEHDFEPEPPPEDVALTPLFDDPARVLLPAGHRLARRRTVPLAELGDDTWIRPHDGSAARLVDHVLREAGLAPAVLLAGRGDEPVEAQPLVAAGKGVALAHELNVIVRSADVVVRPIAGPAPVRHVQAAAVRGQRAPAALAVLDALRAVSPSAGPAARAGSPRRLPPRPPGARARARAPR